MQTENSVFNDLKSQFSQGGMTIKLIYINTVVFLLLKFLVVLDRLFVSSILESIGKSLFLMNTNIFEFLLHPWGIVTSLFAHFSWWHFLMNMLFLYFSGRLFESYFDQRRLLITYLLGGIFGCLFELLAHMIFPALQQTDALIVGASGSIMAIMATMAFYLPNLKVLLFGIWPVRLIILMLLFILNDVFSLGSNDNVAHFAHLGGVVLGLISLKNRYSKKNIVNRFNSFLNWFETSSTSILSKKNHLKVKHNPKYRSTTTKSDADYNLDKKIQQEKIDAILDKISRSGYESLTKIEKELLFNQSKGAK